MNAYPSQGDDKDLEFWKHFAAMGATDKNTMTTVVAWLLAFASAASGYIVTTKDLIGPSFPESFYPVRLMVVSLLGFGVSGLAGYVTLLYGGYTNRNWAQADDIAERRGWRFLLPEYPGYLKPENSTRLNRVAWEWARPCFPKQELAPVFTVYWSMALVGGTVHAVFFVWSFVALMLCS